MNILGISAFYHDSAACLVKNGNIESAAQEERFTRKKHEDSFPSHAIKYCLEHSGITINDVDYITFYDKPFIKFERILESYLSFVPIGISSFLKSIPLWIKKKLWLKDIIKKELNYSGIILFTEHHESHAASAFYPSPFQEAAFITLDGVGEWSTSSFGIGKNNQIQLWADIKFPHSIGLLYSAFTYYLGFKVNSGEYKLMGLAPYGKPKYKNLIYENLIDVKEDGSFKMNMDYFNYCAGLRMTNSKFHQLFGGSPREPETEITELHMDLARSVQEVTEEIIVLIAKHVQNVTGMKNLCLAGGVALNCVANGRLLREKIFDDIWIQPAAGDAGGALGSALFTWYQYLENQRISDHENDEMHGCYLGPEFEDKYIKDYLDQNGYCYKKLKKDELTSVIADLIAEGNVIGWFQGRMEFGPRALGSRSIIGDARSIIMQRKINLKIKFRESFRPFAPAVMEEHVKDYFEINRKSPYMLLVAKVKNEKLLKLKKEEKKYNGLDKLKVARSEVPAITHVDNSARIQTVSCKANLLFHKMIFKFKEKYNCPVIVNTSFNVRGEPIVCTPEEAYTCFVNTDMDYLSIGNFLLKKDEQSKISSDSNRNKLIETAGNMFDNLKEIPKTKKELRKFGLTLGVILLIISAISIWKEYFLFPYFAVGSATLILSSIFLPVILYPFYWIWMTLASILGWIMTRIILIILFYIIVTPIGLFLRFFGKQLLEIKWNKKQHSYWNLREEKLKEKQSYVNQY